MTILDQIPFNYTPKTAQYIKEPLAERGGWWIERVLIFDTPISPSQSRGPFFGSDINFYRTKLSSFFIHSRFVVYFNGRYFCLLFRCVIFRIMRIPYSRKDNKNISNNKTLFTRTLSRFYAAIIRNCKWSRGKNVRELCKFLGSVRWGIV